MLPQQIRYLFCLNQTEMQYLSLVNKPNVCKKMRFVKTLKDALTTRHVHNSFPCSTNSAQKSEAFDLKISLFLYKHPWVFF